MTNAERDRVYKEVFDSFYNNLLAKLPLIVSPDNTVDYLNFTKSVAKKGTHLTLAKMAFYYDSKILEKYKDRIITYNFHMAASSYQVIIQLSRTFHVLFVLSGYDKGQDFALGFVPFFTFENGQGYLDFINENKEYENYAEEREAKAGFQQFH